VGRQKLREVAVLTPEADPADDLPEIPDDRLRLIFTCCHPALPFEARVALTLRTLAGLTTAEIAKAFLTAEPTLLGRLDSLGLKVTHLYGLTEARRAARTGDGV
jgi:RNA polymerase sigma-70 factor (ECF subfamily)